MQRDEYLPLKVIRSGCSTRKPARRTPRHPSPTRREPADELAEPPTGLQMSLDEMSAATGIDRERIRELEGRLVSSRGRVRQYYDGDDYIVLSIVKTSSASASSHGTSPCTGTSPSEASFFESIVMPQLRQRNPDARHGDGLADRAREGLAQAEECSAADEPSPVPVLSVDCSSALRRAGWAVVAFLVPALVLAVVPGLAGAQIGTSAPPPTPVLLPNGRTSMSPFPSVLRTPASPLPPPRILAPASWPISERTGPVRAWRRPAASHRERDEDRHGAPGPRAHGSAGRSSR